MGEFKASRRRVLQGLGASAAFAAASGRLGHRVGRSGDAPCRRCAAAGLAPRPVQAGRHRPAAPDRAHRHLHAGEPLLRQLLRDARPRRRLHASRDGVPTNTQPRRRRATPVPRVPRTPAPATPATARASRGTPATSRSTAARWTASSPRPTAARARWATGTATDLPFYYGAGQHVPDLRPLVLLGARRRRTRTAGTCRRRRRSASSSTDIDEVARDAAPRPTATIWDRLNAHGITWNDYAIDLADIAAVPELLDGEHATSVKTFNEFLTDCANGHAAAGQHRQPRRTRRTPRRTRPTSSSARRTARRSSTR